MTPASHSVVIEPLSHDHWPAIRRLYADGIAAGNAAFKTETTARDAWDLGHLSDRRLVTRLDDAVIAWAALGPVSTRVCHAGVAEHSIYVHKDRRGQGIGKALFFELVRQAERCGY